jgi:hypothetical protein
MNMKRTFAILTLFLFATVAWAEDAAAERGLGSRSFKLNFKSPERAAVVIRPLVSQEGSISIQPATNTLVVTDLPENIRRIGEALQQFDAPAKPFRVELQIVAASRASTPGKVPQDLQEVASKLGAVLRYNSFEMLADFDAQGKEGDSLANLQVGDGYRADVKIGEYDPVSQTLRIEEFRLSKAQPAQQGESTVAPLLKRTSLNLKLGQTLILGASRLPQSDRALMLVLVARPGEPSK